MYLVSFYCKFVTLGRLFSFYEDFEKSKDDFIAELFPIP